MNFRKYQHLERFNTSEVEGIDIGDVYVFPKIDGTNASVWLGDDGEVKAGSRNRELTLDNDNAGFYAWVLEQDNIKSFLSFNPNLRLYGEWLVPHSLRTYRKEAWNKFYVFDVVERDFKTHMKYDDYKPKLEAFGIEYIPPIIIIKDPPEDRLILQLERNNYLIEDGKGNGEGIVLKNYDFVNRFGRQTWAKIVTSEFKEKAHKVMGAPVVGYKDSVEKLIADKYVTKALVDKVYAKIDNDGGFTSKKIPQLLGMVFYDLVREEAWNFVKEHKNPTINFKKLNQFTIGKIKEHLPNIF